MQNSAQRQHLACDCSLLAGSLAPSISTPNDTMGDAESRIESSLSLSIAGTPLATWGRTQQYLNGCLMRLASMAYRFDAMDDDPRLSVCLSEIAPTMNELAAGFYRPTGLVR